MMTTIVRCFICAWVRWGHRALGPLTSAALLLCLLAPGLAHAQEALTLEEAVRLALANNERALKAPLRVKAAEGQLERSRSSFLPTLNASGAGTLSSVRSPGDSALAGSGSLSLNQPLLVLPAIPLYLQSRHQLESERWGATQDRRLLAFDTARAFLVVLTNQNVLEAAKRRLERARANQQNSEARAQAQIASTNDVTRALLETAAAAREVAQATGSVTRAQLSLGFLVGHPVTAPLAAPDRTTHAAETAADASEDTIHQAEARRADVRSTHERTLALSQAANEPLYRLAPTFGATAQVRASLASGNAVGYDESLQLGLSWAIYDAGARYADRKIRLAQAQSQALDERQLRRSIAIDVNTALASLTAARESYRISGDAVAAAQRNTEETQLLYKQGLARAIELIDANAQRFDAEVNRATARLSMEQAYLELRYALGYDALDEVPTTALVGGAR